MSVPCSVLRWAEWATVMYGRVGKLKTRVGKRNFFFGASRRILIKQMFAHPGLKPCRRPCPKIGGSQPQPKTAIAIISSTVKARDCKFGQYICRVHPNKSPLKFWRKGSVGVSRDCPNSLSTLYYLRNG